MAGSSRVPTLALIGGSVFDGESVVRADVTVGADVVLEVGSVTTADLVLEIPGATVLPGLVDAHVHLTLAGGVINRGGPAEVSELAIANARRLLEIGVVEARDLGGRHDVMPGLANGWRAEPGHWPRVHAAGRMITAPGGHGCGNGIGLEAGNPEELRAAVRRMAALGASVVKTALNGARSTVDIDADGLCALVNEAHDYGLRVACHASIAEAVALAVEAGVDTVEHGNGMSAGVARAFAARGGVLVPTLYAFRRDLDVPDGPPADVLLQRIADHGTTVSSARAAGLRIAVGTDMTEGSDVRAFTEECLALSRAGWSPLEILTAATVGGAAAIGREAPAGVRPGHPADLLVVMGDPLADLGALARVVAVVLSGRLVPPT